MKEENFEVQEQELIRHLSFSRYRMEKAYAHLMRQKSWKEDLKLDEFDIESIKPFIEDGAIEVIGQDKEGRALVLVRAARMYPDKLEPYDFVRYYYHQFANAINLCSDTTDSYTILLDVKDSGMSNASISVYSSLFPALNALLVDRMHHMKIYNGNWYFNIFFKFCMKFQSKKTVAKITSYTDDDSELGKDLLEEIDEKYLPKELKKLVAQI